MRDRRAEDPPRRGLRPGAREFAARDRDHVMAAERVSRPALAHGVHAAPGFEMIVPIRLHRLAAAGIAAEIESVPEFIQQHALELAQRHWSRTRAQAGES